MRSKGQTRSLTILLHTPISSKIFREDSVNAMTLESNFVEKSGSEKGFFSRTATFKSAQLLELEFKRCTKSAAKDNPTIPAPAITISYSLSAIVLFRIRRP